MTNTEENINQTVERLALNQVQVIDRPDGSQAIVAPEGAKVIVKSDHEAPLHHISRTVNHQTLESFVEYIERHRGEGTSIAVDLKQLSITAVIDGDHKDTTGWSTHRAVFHPVATSAWEDFKIHFNKWIERDQLAELVNRRLGSFTEPSDAQLLNLVQHFNVSTEAQFSSGERLDSGARTFTYKETAQASGGSGGEVTVPAQFGLDVQPYYDSASYPLDCPFRYRLRDGSLKICIEFANLQELEQVIFEDYVKALDELFQTEDGDENTPPVIYGSI